MNNSGTFNNSKPIVHMKNICKSFGKVQVLKDVDLEVFPGEVHIIAGENGAGKSTLIKILAGAHTDFQGTIEIEGRTVRPGSPHEANDMGIVAIHQELSLVPPLIMVKCQAKSKRCLMHRLRFMENWKIRLEQPSQVQVALLLARKLL